MLEILDLCKTYTAGTTAVSYLNLTVGDSEIIALFGGDGAGKTSLLKVIAGATEKTRGQILLDGKPVVLKDVIMVFDDLALFPKQTVRKNLERSLALRSFENREMTERINMAADYLGLTPVLSERVKTLTELEKRKTALARLILRDDFKLVLVDDILKGLDVADRRELKRLAMPLLTNLYHTVIFATSEAAEAFSIADRVVVMENGSVKQIGTPDEISSRPSCLTVAKLSDENYNVLPARLSLAETLALEFENGSRLSLDGIAGSPCVDEYVGKDVLVGFSARDSVLFDFGVQADFVYAERTEGGRLLHCVSSNGNLTVFDDKGGELSGVVRFLPKIGGVTVFDAVTENSLIK